jgi:Protein of unknown function (DUF3606)
MADDKSKRGGADRRRVARGQAYEVSYFARKHGLTAGQARKIIEQAGGSRERANRLAEKKNKR